MIVIVFFKPIVYLGYVITSNLVSDFSDKLSLFGFILDKLEQSKSQFLCLCLHPQTTKKTIMNIITLTSF